MERHTIEPFYNPDSKILILGSFPSIKSREVGFYYSHPQNRFWKVLAQLYNENVGDINSKKAFLKKHHIALYDVCAACDIKKSSDASIKNIIPNDLTEILHNSQIKKIYVDGKTAYKLYNKYLKEQTGIEAICLPSTSPANASYNFQMLLDEYQKIKE